MWSNLLSAALLYGVLSTTIVVAQSLNGVLNTGTITTATPTGGLGPEVGRLDSTGVDQNINKFKTSTGSDTISSSATSNPAPDGPRESNSDSSLVTSGPRVSEGNTIDAPRGNSGPMPQSSGGGGNNVGAIAGGVVGGVLFLVLVGALIFFLRKRKKAGDPFGSMEKSADERAVNNESPSPLPPAPIATASASSHPNHSPTTPNEGHALMSHYGDTQPQHIPQAQEVQPVIMPAKPYDVNPSSHEIRDGDEDDDGISINSPSPVTTPSPERQQEQQRSVPRLPIYQGGGRKDDVGGNTPPPAL